MHNGVGPAVIDARLLITACVSTSSRSITSISASARRPSTADLPTDRGLQGDDRFVGKETGNDRADPPLTITDRCPHREPTKQELLNSPNVSRQTTQREDRYSADVNTLRTRPRPRQVPAPRGGRRSTTEALGALTALTARPSRRVGWVGGVGHAACNCSHTRSKCSGSRSATKAAASPASQAAELWARPGAGPDATRRFVVQVAAQGRIESSG